LLIAHGSRHAEANADLDHVAAGLRQRGHEIVVASFLELAGPDVLAGGRQCVAAGAARVVLVPYFLSAGVHVRRDLTAAREALAREFPNVEFVLAEALGRHPMLLDVVEQRALEADGANVPQGTSATPIRLALAALAAALLGIFFLLSGQSSSPARPGSLPVPLTDYPFIQPRGYVCYRTPGPITIDGRLDDPAWQAAAWTEDFIDIQGSHLPRPRFRTRVRMLWDDTFLYIAAELEDPHVWGTLTRHDSVIFHDNDFEVFLDPDGDSHLYAELEINALNTTWDLLLTRPYKDGGKAINAWEIPGLRTAVHVMGTLNDPLDTDRGWSVEIAWPWKSLAELNDTPAPPRDGDQWRINFSRVEWQHEVVAGKYRKVPKKAEDNWVWSPQGVIDMHRPERWGVLQFSTAPPGTAAYRPDPSLRLRHQLHRVYYAQRDFRKARGVWAQSLGELGLRDLPASLRLEAAGTGFEATLPQPPRRWHIRSDALIWAD
jgi:hypothetical protein